MRMVNQSSVDELLVVLLVEELTTNHQPHTRHHIVLNQTSNGRAVFWHQILEVSASYKQQAKQTHYTFAAIIQ